MSPYRETVSGSVPGTDRGPSGRERELTAQAGTGSDVRVLVVDDERFAGEAMALLLQQQGYEACIAGSGPEALEIVPLFRPHVVLLDIAMAGMDGFETAARMRAAASGGMQPRLVAVSGYGGEGFATACLQAGFDRCLTKPVTRTTLIGLLAGLL